MDVNYVDTFTTALGLGRGADNHHHPKDGVKGTSTL